MATKKEQQRLDALLVERGLAFLGTAAEYEKRREEIRIATAEKAKANCRMCETAFGRRIAEDRGYVCRESCQDHWEYPPVEDVIYSKHRFEPEA